MLETFFDFIKTLTGIIIVVPPAIFIFTATFLGAAIDKFHEEEQNEINKDKDATKQEIDKLNEKISEAKKSGNPEELLKNLDALKSHKEETDKRIKKIQTRYDSINLLNTLIYPFSCSLMAMFLAHIGLLLVKNNSSWFLVALPVVLILGFLYVAFKKIYKSLSLVQEISVNKKEGEYFENLKTIIKKAISEDREESRSEVLINFIEHKFPLNINVLTEINLLFKIKLNKGSILNNVSVWFFIPDEIELIRPSEKEGWRQGPNYDPPNIRTVRVVVGNLSIGPWTNKNLKIKTTQQKGTYKLKYKVYADGYVGKEDELELIVV